MNICYATYEDLNGWMALVRPIRWNFPGLETEDGLEDYRNCVLRFMDKRQAICVKAENGIAGVMLFSRGRNQICCLAVAPEYRRRGVASLLMNEALDNLDRTKEISVSTFRAEDERGAAPRAFYEKFGFVARELICEMNAPNQKYVLYPAGAEAGRRQRAINEMVRQISGILSDGCPSIYLYGSSVLDDFRLGWSDIDILVLTDKEISEGQAEKLVHLRQAMLEKETDNPYYRSFEGGMLSLQAFLTKTQTRAVYWGTSGERIADHYSLDCFGMKQLLSDGVLLLGRNEREKMQSPDFSALHAGIRHHYDTIRQYARETGRNLYSFGWMLDIARCMYTLRTGKIIGKTAAGEWALENHLCPDEKALRLALAVRKDPMHSKADPSVLEQAAAFGGPVQRFADVLEKEMMIHKGDKEK